MYGIEILVSEHDNILRVLGTCEKACLRILGGAEVPVEDMRQMIDFIRNYADKHHHGKEEKLLFRQMQKELGPVADNLVRHGMLVEHDLARLYVTEWEKGLNAYEEVNEEKSKLDIITYAMAYGKLLHRHIEKENDVVYTFAERKLQKETLDDLDRDTEIFEKEATAAGVQDKYEKLIVDLEEKYND